jgi:glucan 1,3-beta-glucosidase
VPIGYWAYDIAPGEPWIAGQEEYLDRVIGWARTYNVKVLVDLHGAPGSQNGYDNSGQRGAANFANDNNNAVRTRDVLQRIAQKYADPSYWQVVTSLALLNEPATYLDNNLLQTIRQFWYDAYGATRYPWNNANKSGLALVISDGFQPLDTFNGYMPEPQFEGVFIDTHNYQVFDGFYQEWSHDQHIQASDAVAVLITGYLQKDQYIPPVTALAHGR